MEVIGETEDQEIFRSKVIEYYLEFMWDSFAKHIHYFGAFIHLVYIIIFTTYVNLVYLNRDYEHRTTLCWLMLICLIYPMVYDMA